MPWVYKNLKAVVIAKYLHEVSKNKNVNKELVSYNRLQIVITQTYHHSFDKFRDKTARIYTHSITTLNGL